MLLSLLPIALASTPPGVNSIRPPCGTPAAAAALGPKPFLPAPPPGVGGDKDERDAYGSYPNELESENFVMKWGRSGGVDDDAAEALLEAFEYAWAAEIEAMGHPAPDGTDGYLFNVYIGDTGDRAPSGYGTSGYFTRDADGYPMIVISADTLDEPAWARGTAAHEFYHAIQDATERYDYTGDSAWYWEATAMWIEGEVLPDQEDYLAFLFGYGLLPQLPVYFFDYPDSGALQEYHQYGAMIFPRYLSEIAADWELVRDSWTLDLDADTPQDALAELLADRGIDFADAFGDFAARNATWDYAQGELYARWMDWYADYYSSDDHRVVALVDSSGTNGLVAAPVDTLPGRYGYNVVTLARPGADDLVVRFESARNGSDRSPAEWRVTIVRDHEAGGAEYVQIPLEDGAGQVRLENVDGESIHLVAAAVPSFARSNEKDFETFGWSYAITPVPPDEEPVDTDIEEVEDTDSAQPAPTPERPEPGSCACSSGTSGRGAAGLLFVAGLALVGRRRRLR